MRRGVPLSPRRLACDSLPPRRPPHPAARRRRMTRTPARYHRWTRRRSAAPSRGRRRGRRLPGNFHPGLRSRETHSPSRTWSATAVWWARTRSPPCTSSSATSARSSASVPRSSCADTSGCARVCAWMGPFAPEPNFDRNAFWQPILSRLTVPRTQRDPPLVGARRGRHGEP